MFEKMDCFTKGCLLTLPEWIDEVFTFCLKNPRDYYTYRKLSTVTRYFFSDQDHLDVKSDLVDTAEEFEKVGLAKKKFLGFMRKWDDIYAISSKTFLENNIGFNKTFLSGALKWVKSLLFPIFLLPCLHIIKNIFQMIR